MHRNDAAKRAATKSRATQEDYEKLSGPDVWPVIVAEEIRDRYIFQRPEINYLTGLRERLEKATGDELESVRVSISKMTQKNGRRRNEIVGSFVHSIDKDSELEDIRRFLRELRNLLGRIMPERPCPNTTLRLIFFEGNDKTYLGSFSAPWL